MVQVQVIHDAQGRRLTVWLGDPSKKRAREQTTDEVVLIKDAAGKIIGLELSNYDAPGATASSVTVQTVVHVES
jgi:hypothetical protein